MKRLRSAVSLTLALSLVLLSPGSRAYTAAAQTVGSAAGASGASGVTGAVGSSLNRASDVVAVPVFVPALSVSRSLPVAPLVLAPAAVAQARPASAVRPAPAAGRSRAAQQVKPAIAAIKGAMPVISGEAKPAELQAVSARKVFEGLTAKPALDEVVAPGFFPQTHYSGLTASKRDPGDARDPGKVDGTGRPIGDSGPSDDIGNPRRSGGEGGPDDGADPDGGRDGGSELFSMFGVGLLGGGAAALAALTLGQFALFPMIILSLVLHEIGHARKADKLGDPTARLLNRASFNPRYWLTHIDPIGTILIPAVTFLTTGMFFGYARPVPVESRFFKNPVKDMARVALAGPAVNLGLAVAGALAFTGAAAAGLGAGVAAMLGSFVFLNILLALFNLIPLPPLDGGHILKAFLPTGLRGSMDALLGRFGTAGLIVLALILMAAGGYISAGAMWISKLLIGAVMGVSGVQLAGAFLPALAALSLAVSPIVGGPSVPAIMGRSAAPVDLIVMFGERKTTLHDAHISQVDVAVPNGVEQYTSLQEAMLTQLKTAGLDAATLAPFQGTPQATYARINAATIRVDGPKAAEFKALMAERGFKVYENSMRRIIRPIIIKPEDMDPSARGAVTMDENLKIIKADSVIDIARKMWGDPNAGFLGRLWNKAVKSQPPQPKFGVIDSGADMTHPLLTRVKEVKNMTSGENKDDIGHGSWVHSTVLYGAPWARNTTHYKTFLDGNATLDDILKSLTQAGNDGNLVISNSWGSDEGDPASPDSLLVQKLASEGHIMVFAAGNAGSGRNTIGSPAIVTYKDAVTGAIRVVSVAAADRNKKIAYFSSRGPGSPITEKIQNYPHRPDLTAVGYNIEGAWPAALGDADRTDPVLGPQKAISGTSMSTPGVAGAIALLAMMFGVTAMGAKLDAIVNAVMSTLEKTGKNSYDEEGEGFLNVDAAYRKLLGSQP